MNKNKNNKTKYFILIPLFLFIIISSISIVFLSKVPELNTNFLQKKVNQTLEKKSKGTKEDIEYTINYMNISIEKDIHIKTSIDLKSPHFTSQVILKIIGTPVYKKDQEAFYFQPTKKVEFEKLDIDITFDTDKTIKELLSKNESFQNVVKSLEIIQVDVASGISEAVNKQLEKNKKVKRVVKDLSETILTFQLEKTPIYTLPKDTFASHLIKIAVDDVSVENKKIKIHISFLKIFEIIIFILSGIIILIFLISRLIKRNS
jgi:hypothetical protein